MNKEMCENKKTERRGRKANGASQLPAFCELRHGTAAISVLPVFE